MKSTVLVLSLIVNLLPQIGSAATLKVHEWGTFTSVQGSNGELLTGLEHEEEALPSFVHNRDSVTEANKPQGLFSVGYESTAGTSCEHKCGKGECCPRPSPRPSPGGADEAARITQKMETPVLYFYSDENAKVDVTVDFPKGIISQYFPAPTSFLPSQPNLQSLEGGQISYKGLSILADMRNEKLFPPVIAGNVYAPARETAANPVQIGGETERFIFYRGLGDFKTALRVSSNNELLTIANFGQHKVPYILALNIRNGKGAFKELGELAGVRSTRFNLKDFNRDLTPKETLASFENSVGPKLVAALVQSGLYQDEAQSMVNTWKTSYFHTDGLRILYVLSREETDAILPIKIAPQPAELVRTLVGRVEVVTTTEETNLLTSITDIAAQNKNLDAELPLGRFKQPKLLRVQQLSKDPSVLRFIKSELR